MITHPDSQVTMYTDCEPQDGGGRRLPQLITCQPISLYMATC